MASSSKAPKVMIHEAHRLCGFMVRKVTVLEEMRAVAYELVHEKSGASLFHLHTHDPENLMAIAFRTPPPDDTGLPHILEHTVLCGSRRYPVKDPFVELLKTSLATFLNAMTYPDKTVYPCASMVEKDFFNLAAVYCDAVFHPLLTDKHFKQEGHHLDFAEPGNPDSPLIIKGIVYNEMKGVYSDLDGIIERTISRSLCPDNAYGRDSGGDPDSIPDLTYERFVRFHQTYYHPSNAFIFLYGNIPTARHLDFLDRECLSEFSRIQVDTTISIQPRWSAPRMETVTYPIAPGEEAKRKAAVVMTFLANEVTEAVTTLSMVLLDSYLLSNAASPLRKALIDSKLGEELTASGYASHQRDTYFTVGLKGTEPDRADAIVNLVKTTCERLVKEGLETEKVEAAFHRLELASREIPTLYPLHLMERVYRAWLYEADPLHNLRLNDHLRELRRLYQTEERFFERILDEKIVKNPHCSILTFVPDRAYLEKKEQAFQRRMSVVKSRLSEEELKGVMQEAAELDALQSAPNPPEALATLPRLTLPDVPAVPFELDTTMERANGVPVLYTDIFSNGLNYIHLAVDLRGIDEALIDYLPLYAEALRKMGAGDLDYVAMAEREAATTGGIGVGLFANGSVGDPHRFRPYLTISSSALNAKLPEMLDILSDRIIRCDMTDRDRLRDVILQGRVARRSQIIANGWHYAALYAERGISRNCAVSERIAGISQIRLFDLLAENFHSLENELVEKLEAIRDFLLGKGRLTVSFVGGEEQLSRVLQYVAGLSGDLRKESPPEDASVFQPVLGKREAIAVPAEVSFVASSFPVVGAAHGDAPALLLLSVHLSYGYLWERVRVKGGAYGVRANYNTLGAVFGLSSYRDPFIKETLDAYRDAFRYIAEEMDLSAPAVEQAIIGTIKTMDRPIRPSQAAGIALGRHLNGETPEFRKRFRASLLSLSGRDILRAGSELLAPAFNKRSVCVLSSKEKLASANKILTEDALEITEI